MSRPQLLTEYRRRTLLIEQRRRNHAQVLASSFRQFIREAWGVVEPAVPFIPNWHIDAIADHLQAVTEGRIRRLLINIPPGHAKSLLVSVLWPAWVWTRDPQWRSLFASYAEELSIRDSVKCRALLDSDWYQKTFMPQWRMSEDQNAKGFFQNDKLGFRIALSVGSKGTGFRGNAIVVDDPLNAKDQHSEVARKEVLFWWDQVMSSRLNNLETGTKVIIMQRLHEEDLSGHVLAKGGYEHLCLPSEFESDRRSVTSIGFSDPRTQDGELLFPALFPQKVLDDAKANDLGSFGFAGQHQQRPSPAEGGIIKRHWWRYWEAKRTGTAGCTLLPARFDEIILSVDCSFKDTKNSDFVSLQAWGRRGADKFLLDRVNERLDYVATVDAFEKFCWKWPLARAKYVEEKANGAALISQMRSRIPGIIPVNPTDSKTARAYAETPDIEAGNVFLPHPSFAPWVNEFIEQCAGFPNAAHDDDVDAMTQALAKMRKSNSPMFVQTSAGW